MSREFLLSGGVLEQQLDSLFFGGKHSWREIIEAEFAGDSNKYISLDQHLTHLYETGAVNPRKENIFRAFRDCSFEDCRVCILGQDPYPNSSHAVGLSFSIPAGCKQPPSLKNILKELEDDIGPDIRVRDGDLSHWAKQGVLLLNTSLTVDAGNPNSHKTLWDGFAVNILAQLNTRQEKPLVFLLWGKHAEGIGRHLEKCAPSSFPRKFIYSVHPSPLSAYRGFLGSKQFSQTNEFLIENGAPPIKW